MMWNTRSPVCTDEVDGHYVSVKKAAELLAVTCQRIRAAIRASNLEAIKVNGIWLIERGQIH